MKEQANQLKGGGYLTGNGLVRVRNLFIRSFTLNKERKNEPLFMENYNNSNPL
jgi:hypothetical protein